jgi:phosphoglycerate dehydrogenase-like enzyme
LPEPQLALVRAAVPDADVTQLSDASAWHAAILQTDVWLAHSAQVCAAPALGSRLRWVQLSSAGAEVLFASPRIEAPVIYTNASGVQSVGIAEYVMGMLACFSRQIPLLLGMQAERRWPKPGEVFERLMANELRGATLGLVGYGSINSAVAQLAHAYGMRVLACKRNPAAHGVPRWNPKGVGDAKGRLPERWYGPAQMGDMLANCDYVVVACPLTPQTTGMVDERFFAAMGKQAIFINVGRGGLVKEPALIQALRDGQIAGAAVDVVGREPLPAESELYDAPRLIITPHISSATTLYFERMTELFVENLRRDAAQESLLNVVNRELGY